MNPAEQFRHECSENIARQGNDQDLVSASIRWMLSTSPYKYTYNFTWMGVPVIQFPQDLIALQEIVWRVRPRRIVETGIAHGGSLIFYASLLELLGGDGHVIGIDVDMRAHNRAVIEAHPMARRITMIEGSSTDATVVDRVAESVIGAGPVMVVLDSNHTHEHVLSELRAYASLVSSGSYVVVCDTTIDDAPDGFFSDRPWNKASNPRTAVREFLSGTDRFEVDTTIDDKLLVSVGRGGYLRCVKG